MGAATTSVRCDASQTQASSHAQPNSSPSAPASTGRHTNIVWSNGALDPWSGQGVYPPGGGPGGPMVQNVSADGSQIALILDLGAHHLDLMFSDPRNPPCFAAARAVEEQRITQWIQEAYDAHRGDK